MIRPVTVVTFLMACGSGLYLYQSKHEVQVLDHTIERVVRETNALREQSRLLATEWTVLNDPERLRQFSDTYLRLKTISPSQFTSLADLDNRLPAPVVEMPPGETEDEAVPVTVDTGPQAAPSPIADAVVPEALPVPPVPAAHPVPPVTAAAARPAEVKVAARPMSADPAPRSATVNDARPMDTRASDARAPEARVAEQRAADQHVAARVADNRSAVRDVPPLPVSVPTVPVSSGSAPPRPVVQAPARAIPASATATVVPAPARPVRPTPVAQAAVAAPAGSVGGSLLGMARAGAPPAPRPMPVNATYNAN